MLKHLSILALAIMVACIDCIKNDAAINVTTPEKYKTAPIDQDYSQIQDPKDRWDAYALKNYMIVQRLSCFCPPRGPFKVFVVDNELKEVLDIETEKYYSKEFARNNRILSVEDLFNLANSINTDSVAHFLIEYDSKYGFPNLISIDYEV